MSEHTAGSRRVAGRYILGETLGRGGMGTVYRAEDELLGRSVAIKEVEIPAALTEAEREVTRARVLREARAAARLSHPGVVTVHDVIEDVGRVYIVMELVPAPTLGDVVRDHGPLPPARVARIGDQILDVLTLAHEAGIVHRDVKPANVMMLPHDRVKLTDFGIASLRGDPQLTSAEVVLGSPAYMAPEQAGGQPIGPAVDLWALGATLYHAVEGHPAFQGTDPREVLAAILTQSPEPARLAGPLAPVLSALMSRNPEDRPGGERLHELLAQAATAGPAPITVESPAPRAAAVPPSAVAGTTVTAGSGVPATAVAAPPGTPPGTLPPPAGSTDARYTPAIFADETSKRMLPVVLGVGAVVVVAIIALVVVVSRSGASGGGARNQVSASHPPAASNTPTSRSANPPATASEPAPEPTGQATGNAPAGSSAPVPLAVTSVGPPGQVLPRFWASATNRAGGYRIGIPAGFWQVTGVGSTTYAEWPSDATFNAAFEVHQYPASQDPYGLLQHESAAFARAHGSDQYKLQKLNRNWTYRHGPAAAWEYTWVRNGDLTRARIVAFRAASHTYTVLYRSKDVWWYGGGTAEFPEGFELAFTPLT